LKIEIGPGWKLLPYGDKFTSSLNLNMQKLHIFPSGVIAAWRKLSKTVDQKMINNCWNENFNVTSCVYEFYHHSHTPTHTQMYKQTWTFCFIIQNSSGLVFVCIPAIGKGNLKCKINLSSIARRNVLLCWKRIKFSFYDCVLYIKNT
jgi:hypothetical protein